MTIHIKKMSQREFLHKSYRKYLAYHRSNPQSDFFISQYKIADRASTMQVKTLIVVISFCIRKYVYYDLYFR